MAMENPQHTPPEGLTARLSHWMTGSVFLPFETGLTFSTIPIFLLMYGKPGTWFEYWGDLTLPIVFAVLAFIPGFLLGFPLRKMLAQIGEGSRPENTPVILVIVAFAWLMMFVLVIFIIIWFTAMG